MSPGGSVAITGSVVANNSSRDGDCDLTGNFNVVKSLIKTSGFAVIAGSGNILNQDPQLGPLRDNGGPTLTMLPAFDSPVIDAGVFDSSMSTTDQRGQPRGAPAGHPDMGAVERQYPEDFIFRDGFGSP
ncbi:MAG TPA: choice-of-anchor Q domain-containing protein [Rudaea sp.]|nr:choice-of-anchor Q domain-containing protein [Rudaea sp.]